MQEIPDFMFTNRAFGVEIEFLDRLGDNGYGGYYNISDMHDSDPGLVDEVFADQGIDARLVGYTHMTTNYWKIVPDSSCGYEAVSPILRETYGLEAIEKVCVALKTLNAKVDQRCGLHVHQYVGDLSLEHLKNLFQLYIRYEEAIDGLLPKSRKNNYHAQSICQNHEPVRISQNIERSPTIREMCWVIDYRYTKLNWQAYPLYGTVEFRQHSGTLDVNKINSWVILTNAMINRSKVRVPPLNEDYDQDDFFQDMGMTDTKDPVVQYWLSRQRRFSKNTPKAPATQDAPQPPIYRTMWDAPALPEAQASQDAPQHPAAPAGQDVLEVQEDAPNISVESYSNQLNRVMGRYMDEYSGSA